MSSWDDDAFGETPTNNDGFGSTSNGNGGNSFGEKPRYREKRQGNDNSDGFGGNSFDEKPRYREKRQCDDQNKKSFGGENGVNGVNGEEARPPPCRPSEIDLNEETQFKNESGINFDRYDRIDVQCHGANITPVEEFKTLITSQLLLSNINKAGYTKMTPIQKYTFAIMMAKKDMVGCAQTGSGKTAAFILPVLQTLITDPDLPSLYGRDLQEPSCIVMAPTRELARQTYVEALKFSRDSVVKCACIYGGTEMNWCRAQLSNGAHILVSTPGRLKDFINRGLVGLKRLQYVILDEGDRLIDDGFVSDMRAFFTHPDMPPTHQRQTLFFSATFKDEAQRVAREFMKPDYVFITVGLVGAANEDVKQEFVQVSRSDKKRELKKILQDLSPEDKVIVFTQTKSTADVISGYLTAQSIECTSIHGDRHQSQREQALREFKSGKRRCLVASPVGERGLDLPKVSVVINYDLPRHLDEYVHRIGRTGRIGNTGRAISFFDPERDQDIVAELSRALKQAQQTVPDFFSGNCSIGGPSSDSFSSPSNLFSASNSTPADEEVW